MEIIGRAEWGARPPTKVIPTTWDRKTEFIVHYSGAARSQSVKSIQDYCMDSKGHSDIDYCFVVKDGQIYEGRGWLNIGSHTLGHNTVGIGVCVVGEDGDATAADRAAVRWLYDEACRQAGRALAKLGHQDANPGATDCPGSQLEAWVRAGMPAPAEGEDMFCAIGDKGTTAVRYLQRRIVRAGGDLSDVGGVDGQYGAGTARELAKLVGGDGASFDDAAADALDEILRAKTAGATVGGAKTPTEVTIDGPIVARVTAVS